MVFVVSCLMSLLFQFSQGAPNYSNYTVVGELVQANVNKTHDVFKNVEQDFKWMIGPWVKYPHNPILTAGDYKWESIKMCLILPQ